MPITQVDGAYADLPVHLAVALDGAGCDPAAWLDSDYADSAELAQWLEHAGPQLKRVLG